MEMQRQAAMVLLPDGSGRSVEMRIGMHSGPLMSGIIGSIRKRYTVIGSTVNIASRMESTGVPNRIHVSSTTHELLVTTPVSADEMIASGLMGEARPRAPLKQVRGVSESCASLDTCSLLCVFRTLPLCKEWERRAATFVKGIGEMETYLLRQQDGDSYGQGVSGSQILMHTTSVEGESDDRSGNLHLTSIGLQKSRLRSPFTN